MSKFFCEEGCGVHVNVCHDCPKKPDPYSCDNCEYIRRFGSGIPYIPDSHKCSLCGEIRGRHDGWHCPERKEWKLSSGVILKDDIGTRYFHITTREGKDCIVYKRSKIPSLIKALQEIHGSER